MVFPIHRHSSLFHYFQKGGLGLAGSTVDLICQQKVAHDSPGTIGKLSALFVIHGKSGHIGRDNIRCKLDTVEFHSHKTAQCQCGCGLTNTRHIFQKYMPLCKHCHENLICDIFFSFNDPLQLILEFFYLLRHFLSSILICGLSYQKSCFPYPDSAGKPPVHRIPGLLPWGCFPRPGYV